MLSRIRDANFLPIPYEPFYAIFTRIVFQSDRGTRAKVSCCPSLADRYEGLALATEQFARQSKHGLGSGRTRCSGTASFETAVQTVPPRELKHVTRRASQLHLPGVTPEPLCQLPPIAAQLVESPATPWSRCDDGTQFWVAVAPQLI